MSFFDQIKDVTYVNSPGQFFQRGSDEIFSASIVKICTGYTQQGCVVYRRSRRSEALTGLVQRRR